MMGWIKERILQEHKKHKDLDWALIAEKKIEKTYTEIENRKIEEILERMNECMILTDMPGLRELYKELYKESKAVLRRYNVKPDDLKLF